MQVNSAQVKSPSGSDAESRRSSYLISRGQHGICTAVHIYGGKYTDEHIDELESDDGDALVTSASVEWRMCR